jgi:hypothetical protein
VIVVRGLGIFIGSLRPKCRISNNSMMVFGEMGLILLKEIVWVA